jgi:hypothetical protein
MGDEASHLCTSFVDRRCQFKASFRNYTIALDHAGDDVLRLLDHVKVCIRQSHWKRAVRCLEAVSVVIANEVPALVQWNASLPERLVTAVASTWGLFFATAEPIWASRAKSCGKSSCVLLTARQMTARDAIIRELIPSGRPHPGSRHVAALLHDCSLLVQRIARYDGLRFSKVPAKDCAKEVLGGDGRQGAKKGFRVTDDASDKVLELCRGGAECLRVLVWRFRSLQVRALAAEREGGCVCYSKSG